MPYRTLRMSYRRRGNRDASLADTFSKTERLLARSSINLVRLRTFILFR